MKMYELLGSFFLFLHFRKGSAVQKASDLKKIRPHLCEICEMQQGVKE